MIGRELSHYRIVAVIGRGGMGEVYLAEDTRLRRKVALKFLPRHLTSDADARRRFEREARAAAALNHPNIVTVHEIDEHDGQVYIAMEYVDGPTLRDRMSGGGVSPAEAAEIISQLCDGLEKAHNADIVHRDLKPENIKIDGDGRVKILDFGLAKLRGATRLTRESSTPGTIHYMSPEQARGDDVDARTDVWSLGVILYELLTGVPPFRGEFEQAVVYSIINEDPEPVGALRRDVPEIMESVVAGALKKEPGERFQDVKAVRAALGGTTGGSDSKPDPAVPRRKSRLPVTAAVIAVMVVVAALLYFGRKPGKPEYSPPIQRQVTFTGDCGAAALSLDGNFLAYSSRHEDERGIFVKDLRSGSAVCIYSAPRCWIVDWSPDGDLLLFRSFINDTTMGTFVIPRLGGNPRRIHKTPWPYFAWSPDGGRIADIGVGERTLEIIDLEKNETQSFDLDPEMGEVASLDWSKTRDELLVQTEEGGSHVFRSFLPDGTNSRVVWRGESGSGRPLLSPRWSYNDRAIYYFQFSMRGQASWDLMKLRIDKKSGRAAGEPTVVLHSMQLFDGGSTTGDGNTLQYTRETRQSNLWLVRIAGEGGNRTTEKSQLTYGTSWKSRAQISPDGKRIVFAMSEGEASNIYTLPLEPQPGGGATPRQLTFFDSLNDMPVWSPDGAEIVFMSSQGGQPALWRMGADGENPRQIEGSAFNYQDGDYITWDPGPEIIFRASGARNFVVLDPGTGNRHPLVEDEEVGYIFMPCWSNDGTRIAMFWNREKQRSPSMDVWILSREDKSRRMVAGGLYNPIVWSSDDNWIYAVNYGGGLSNGLYRIPVDGGIPELYATLPFEALYADLMSITPDGGTVVYAETNVSRDVWIVDNFDPGVE